MLGYNRWSMWTVEQSCSYLVSQLSVDRLQFLTMWTGQRVELDQNIFTWIVDNVVKGLCNNHLQHSQVRG